MINYQKDFDLHITVELESSGIFKAKSIFGISTHVVYEYDDTDEACAIAGLNDQLASSLIYKSLNRDPTLSVWPNPIPSLGGVPGLGQSNRIFNLHINCGSCVESSNGVVLYTYAYTESAILAPVQYQVIGRKDNHWDAIDNLIKLLDLQHVFNVYTQFPNSSVFPFAGKASQNSSGPGGSVSSSSNPQNGGIAPPVPTPPPTPVTRTAHVPAEIKKKQLKRRLPSDIINIVHPACQDVCTSWDIFGEVKCKNMCEWRKEV